MQITCERCATTYLLDDKLLPPGGAPVQCTRCGLVFTAHPGGPTAPAVAPRPTAPPPSARRDAGASPAPDRRGTQMFGQQSPGQGAPQRGAEAFAGPTADGPSRRAPVSGPNNQPPDAALGDSTVLVRPGELTGLSPDASKRTQVFGASDAAPAGESEASNRTMMFGRVAPTREDAQSPSPHARGPLEERPSADRFDSSRTVIFGAPASEPADEDAQSSNRTVIFGAPGPSADRAPDEESGEPSRSDRTLVFGKSRPFPSAPAAGAPTSSAAGVGRESRGTQMFGAPQADSEAESLRGEHAAVAGSEAPAVEMPAVPLPAQDGSGEPPEGSDLESSSQDPAPEAHASQTPLETLLVTGSEAESGDTATPAPVAESQALEEDSLESLPGGSGGEPAAAPGEAPPSAVWQQPLETPPPRPRKGTVKAGSQTMQLQLALKKSQMRLPVILAVAAALLLIAVAGVGYWKWHTPKADSALVAADQAALNLMKRDDAGSIKQAIAVWQGIGAKDPKFLPAQANQIMAYTLLSQDLGEEIRRLTAQAAIAQKEMKRLEERRDTADFAKKANEKREELVRLSAQMEPLQEEARKSDQKAGELIGRCKQLAASGPDGASAFRATALYYGMKHSDLVEKLAETYRRSADERGVLHDDKRAFADLAVAAFFSQPRLAPEKAEKGLAAVRVALEKDPALLRARLLQAKILLASRQLASARKVVDELVATNPSHYAAARLTHDIELAASEPPQ